MEAKKRGTLFDLGHGAGSFCCLRNAIPAYEQGFYPEYTFHRFYILHNVNGPAYGLLNVMSKYFEYRNAVRRSTVQNDSTSGRDYRTFGARKITSGNGCRYICSESKKRVILDLQIAEMHECRENKMLECMLTIRAGEFVYNPMAYGMPDWKSTPESYRIAPGVIEL